MTTAERETRQAILDAAADLIGERGYRATTTRAIAQRAGVNEVTIFRQFGTKKGLLQALGEQWAGTMAGFAVAHIPHAEDTAGTLRALAEMEVRQAMHAGAPAMRLAFDAVSEPEVMEVMGTGPASNLDGLAEYLATRQQAGEIRQDLDPRAMAEAFFALTSTYVMSRQVLGDRIGAGSDEPEEIAGRMMEIFLSGVGAQRSA